MNRLSPPACICVGPEAAGLIAAMQARTFPSAWEPNVLEVMLSAPGGRGIVARIAEAPVGFGVIQCASDEAEVISVGVEPAARRRGVGRALVRHMADAARTAGAVRLFLEVSEGNAAALALYRGCGFHEVGRWLRYYADGSSALTCRLDLAKGGEN